jgi:hypothetical protein
VVFGWVFFWANLLVNILISQQFCQIHKKHHNILFVADPALLCSNAYVINFLIAYFFVFHVPLVHRILKLPVVWQLVMALDVFNSAFSVMQGGVGRAMGAAHSIQGSVIGLIILGTFAGIGGRYNTKITILNEEHQAFELMNLEFTHKLS